MNSPIRWYGGKGVLAPRIIPFFKDHVCYVEVFGGGASVLFAKRPSPVEVYNDLDSGVVGFFKVLADEKLFPRFERRVIALPYSRELCDDYGKTWEKQKDVVERAARWFVAIKQSFGGSLKNGWSYERGAERKSKGCATQWMKTVEGLHNFHKRLGGVQIEHASWEKLFLAYDSPDTLFYCDPPYVKETRKKGSTEVYNHEMTAEQHTALVQTLLTVKGQVVLSGYEHPIYAPLTDAGWHKELIQTTDNTANTNTNEGKKRKPRTEILWVKPIGKQGLWK